MRILLDPKIIEKSTKEDMFTGRIHQMLRTRSLASNTWKRLHTPF